ncbi:MAG: diacylglycerol kinase family lipid kinase [Flavobacteriaceae bacterium]|nr:MAG: diacylglycerol kinase family lipid kinase [Flavobacteriaceae bacterium]
MASKTKWLVIINPTSGNGSSKKKWPEIQRLLQVHEFDYDHVFTSYPNHSILLTQTAVNQGYTRIICVGGDGTIHNIVNGIMSQTASDISKVTLGVIPIGTGNDWVKTHGISKDISKAIETIKKGRTSIQDVGKIDLDVQGTGPIYFNNLAGIGFDAFVVKKVKAYKHLGAIAYFLGAIIGLFNFKIFKAWIRFNSEEREVNALMILIGLCQYSGGGMQLTESPDPSDGLFDLSITNNFGRFDVLRNMVNLFNGKVTSSQKIETVKTKEIEVKVDAPKPYIQADGELIGRGNFKVTIIPKALRFYSEN